VVPTSEHGAADRAEPDASVGSLPT
jgi:hypothetical protein